MRVRDLYMMYLTKRGHTSMLSVSIHIFAVIGTGHNWDENGELSCDSDPNYVFEPTELHQCEFPHLNAAWRLEHEAKKLKREFTQDNLATMLDSGVVSTPFIPDYMYESHYVKRPSVRHANAFCYPPNITGEWAHAVYTFLDWWKIRIRNIYGVTDPTGKKEPLQHWPESIRFAHKQMALTARALRIISSGLSVEDYVKHEEETIQLMQRITHDLGSKSG